MILSTCCVNDIKGFLFLAQSKIEDWTEMLLGKTIPKLVTEESHSAGVNPERKIPKYAEGQLAKQNVFSIFSFYKLFMYISTSCPRVIYSSTLALYNDTAAKNQFQIQVSLTLVEHTTV